jgi:putative endonuclease
MGSVNQIIGGYGECLAARYAVAQGMVVVDRNWRCPAGELDLVLHEGRELVFCEVKTRRTLRYGLPVEAVVPAKVRRLRRLAARWMAATRAHPRRVRFDVISIVLDGGVARVSHLRRAF